WCLTVVPSTPEPCFADAASTCASVVETGSAYAFPEVALLHALDPAMPLADVAWLALAAALVGRAEDVRRPATDVLVQTVEDGRFDADELGRQVGWLVGRGIGKVPRLAGPLGDAGRVSPLHARQMVAAVEAVLAALPRTPPALHPVLEVALELAAGAGARVESAAGRAALQRIGGEV